MFFCRKKRVEAPLNTAGNNKKSPRGIPFALVATPAGFLAAAADADQEPTTPLPTAARSGSTENELVATVAVAPNWLLLVGKRVTPVVEVAV